MTRGGKRPGSGRPSRGGGAALERTTVWLNEAERAELTAALRDGETLSDVLRDGGLQLARRRKPKETTMTTTKTITGEFDRAALDKLTWPVAWSGTVPQADRDAYAAEVSVLVAEAREALDAEPDATAVEIVHGEVVATIG